MKKEKKAKGKGKGKGKAIIGIAMTTIMVASVIAAMVPPAAAFVRDPRPVVPAFVAPGPVVVIGELIFFMLPAGIYTQIQYCTVSAGTYIPTGQVLFVTAAGLDTADATTVGVYMDDWGNFLTLTDPKLDLRLQLGAAEVSSVVAGQRIDVVVDTNIPGAISTIPPLAAPAGGPNDLKLTIIDDIGIETNAGIGAPAPGAPAGTMWSVTTGAGGLPLGDYTFTVETYTTGPAMASIDIESAEKDMTVQTLKILVESDVSEQVMGNDVVITTTAGAGICVTVNLAGASGIFDVTKGDYPTRAFSGTATTFIATVPADGTLTAVITSATPGGVIVRATVTGTTVTDTLDITFKKPTTTVEVSTNKVAIGNTVTIKGTTDFGGDEVAIFVDNVLQQRAAVEADNTYEWEWDTGLVATPKPGMVTIKVFEIHPFDIIGPIGEGLDVRCGGKDTVVPFSTFFDVFGFGITRQKDASTWILAMEGELAATMEALRGAKGNDIVVKGTAAGESQIRVILIDKDGVPLADSFELVLEDDTFEYTLPTTTAWDSGTYKVVVISDGSDDSTLLTGGCDITGWGNCPAVPTQEGIWAATLPAGMEQCGRLTTSGVTIAGVDVASLTQSQLIAKIENLVNTSGSDDKMVVLSFRVEEPSVELEAIESVAVGEPLNIRGTTNREPGTKIGMWTIEGHIMLPPVITEVEWPTADTGVFSATIDTTNAVPGTYTLEADDGEGNTDTATVEILVPSPPAPEVSISTEKKEYSPGDVINTTIRLSNPADNAQNMLFKWYFIRDYNNWTKIEQTTINLSANSDQSSMTSIPVEDWGNKSFCGCYIVSLTNTTTNNVVSVDSASWIYLPSAGS